MSFAFELSDNPESFGTVIKLRRTDGVWKGSPNFLFQYEILKNLRVIRNFEIFEDDIWMTGYFGTYSPLINEIVWLLNNELDFETATKQPTSDRFQFFE